MALAITVANVVSYGFSVFILFFIPVHRRSSPSESSWGVPLKTPMTYW
jgi:hypothetical protein